MYFDTTFVGCSESESWEMCAGASTSVSSRLSVNSSNHSGRSRKRSTESRLPSLFWFWFWVFGSGPRQCPGAKPSLRSWAELVEDESCNVDVEDDLLPELDRPGTASGTKLSVVHIIGFSSLVNRGFWPLTHSQEYPWSSQSLPSDRTASVSSCNCTVTKRSRSWMYTCASSFACTSPLAVTTVAGFLDLRKVSSSSELKSFLLSKCINAPESTTTSTDVYQRSFVRTLELVNKFSQSSMLLRGRIVLGARIPHVIFPRILARKDYAHEAHTHTFGQSLAMDPFFPISLFGATCPWRIWRRDLLHIFRVHVE